MPSAVCIERIEVEFAGPDVDPLWFRRHGRGVININHPKVGKEWGVFIHSGLQPYQETVTSAIPRYTTSTQWPAEITTVCWVARCVAAMFIAKNQDMNSRQLCNRSQSNCGRPSPSRDSQQQNVGARLSFNPTHTKNHDFGLDVKRGPVFTTTN